ncbi:RNA polymerase sigma factor [Virgibacillus sp. LDC1]|uniref:RNA polymerase sigma factor n=1 Tax=Paenibacillus sp. 843 TaxID=3341795 RepID=UPI00372C5399|nr:RNA polymerase sigma factor [Virgibacillus sp. LDC1]
MIPSGGALQELEEKSKSVVVLHYLSEWSMKEIGQFLNMSVSAVESRIRRAREVLKQHLARDFEHYFHTPSGIFLSIVIFSCSL